jgi:plastocyanin
MIRVLAIGSTLAVLVLAGCGGGSSSNTSSSSAPASTTGTASSQSGASTSAAAGGSGKTLKLAADSSGQLKFDKTSLTASSGKITIDFTNASPVGHNVTVASSGGSIAGATPTFQGGSKTLTLHLKPGTYTFYCSVPGHRQAGMQGTLVVK